MGGELYKYMCTQGFTNNITYGKYYYAYNVHYIHMYMYMYTVHVYGTQSKTPLHQ